MKQEFVSDSLPFAIVVLAYDIAAMDKGKKDIRFNQVRVKGVSGGLP